MSSQISHTAIVTSIGAQSVTVSVDGDSGCSGCRVSMLCGHNEGNITQVVTVDNPSRFIVGERVNLTATSSSIWLAIVIGLMLPCIILLSMLLGCVAAGVSTAMAVLITFAALAVYYVVLAFNRRIVDTNVRWTVEKTS